MSSAGQQLVAGRIPGEEIAVDIETAAGTSSTSEIVDMSVTAPVVSGRTYWVIADFAIDGTDDDVALVRLREDSISGTELVARRLRLNTVGGTTGTAMPLRVRYTAGTTEDKTFVLTHESGVASNLAGGSTTPCYFWVEYVSG